MAGVNRAVPMAGFTWAAAPLFLGGQKIPGSLNFDLPLAGMQTNAASQAYAFTGSNINNILGFSSGVYGNALWSQNIAQQSAQNNQQDVLSYAQSAPSPASGLAQSSIASATNYAYTSLGSFDALMMRLFG